MTKGLVRYHANNVGCWNYNQFGNRNSQSMSTTACGSNPPLMSWATYKGTPDLVIQSGDLSDGDSKTFAPDGTPGTSTVQGNTDPNITSDGKSGDPIITIDNRTNKDDTLGVLTHEIVHGGSPRRTLLNFRRTTQMRKRPSQIAMTEDPVVVEGIVRNRFVNQLIRKHSGQGLPRPPCFTNSRTNQDRTNIGTCRCEPLVQHLRLYQNKAQRLLSALHPDS